LLVLDWLSFAARSGMLVAAFALDADARQRTKSAEKASSDRRLAARLASLMSERATSTESI
jgi:hypothetical protein